MNSLDNYMAERRIASAQVCECGHRRDVHLERVASCCSCRCASFAVSERTAADIDQMWRPSDGGSR